MKSINTKTKLKINIEQVTKRDACGRTRNVDLRSFLSDLKSSIDILTKGIPLGTCSIFKRSFNLILSSYLLVFVACKPDPGPPHNPFDDIDYTGGKMPEVPEPDSASLIGLHQYIFAKSCAVPGCHDGSFEPDYRTVQSTHSTLVYQPVIKNDPDNSYTYRVVPKDVDASWLYYRVTTDDQTLGRMPLYDNPLTEGQLNALRDWINAGAPDMFGNSSTYPNTQPAITAIAAFNKAGNIEVRRDTARVEGNPVYPFIAAKNLQLDIWVGITDDSTDVAQLQNTRLAFSGHYDDFSQAVEISAVYNANPKVIPDFNGNGQAATFYWRVTIDAGQELPVDENGITFCRLITNDGNHTEDYEFPRPPHPIEFKLYLSFVRV